MAVSTSIEMLMTEKREMAIKMERRRGNKEKEVKFTGLYLYWMSCDGADEGDGHMEDLLLGLGGLEGLLLDLSHIEDNRNCGC